MNRVFEQNRQQRPTANEPAANPAPSGGLLETHMRVVALLIVASVLSTGVAGSGEGSHADSTAWRQFAGPHGDFSAPLDEPLAPWPDTGPGRVWTAELGTGHAGIVADDRLVVGFYRAPGEAQESETVAGFDPSDGSRRWTHSYPAPGREGNLQQFGLGPHATPLLLEDRVITLGYTGELRALDRKSGTLLWQHHLLDDFGGSVLRWGYSASPVLVDGEVVVMVGGSRASVVAFDPASGSVRWDAAAGTVSYAAPLAVEVDGHRQILYFAKDALHSIRPGGKPLWSVPVVNGYENHASLPVVLPGNRLFVVSQQEAASRLLRLSDDGTTAAAEELWTNTRVRVHYWNSIHQGATLFASSGDSVQVLHALDVETGETRWRDRAVGRVNFLSIGAQTLALSDEGELLLLTLTDEGVEVVSRAAIAQGETWAAATLVGRRLYVRDQERLYAFNL